VQPPQRVRSVPGTQLPWHWIWYCGQFELPADPPVPDPAGPPSPLPPPVPPCAVPPLPELPAAPALPPVAAPLLPALPELPPCAAPPLPPLVESRNSNSSYEWVHAPASAPSASGQERSKWGRIFKTVRSL